jgi:transposase
VIVHEQAQRQSGCGRRIRLMFQDEGRFGRINSPRRCWAPEGLRPEVQVQVVREYVYAYAAISPHDGVMDSLILPVVNTEAMSIFLEEVAARHSEEYIVMVMDQASWHKANALRIPENMSLVWQPPYSPQCNPVEHIWEEIREKWFPNLVFKNLDGVVDTLAGALATLENDWVRTQSITGFDWIVSLSLKAT